MAYFMACFIVLQSAAEKREYALQLLGQKEAAVVRRRKELQVST